MGLMGEERNNLKWEERLENLYKQIGKRFYESNQDTELTDSVYRELFDQIRNMQQEKEKAELLFLARQGKRKCYNCQNLLALESRFCNMCGGKFREIPKEWLEQGDITSQRKCQGCGTTLEPDSVFCANCGKRC